MLSSRSLKALVLGCVVVLAGCDRQSAQNAQPAASAGAAAAPGGAAGDQAATIDRSHKGSELPEFLLRDPAGRELKLSSLKGKPLLINLWATWCAPCVAELPALDRLAGRDGAALKVLTVSQDMGKPDAVPAFLRARGVKRLEPWVDSAGDLAAHYGVDVLPTTILYDANGREVWRMSGANDWDRPQTAALIAEAG